jgi:chromosome segregation ATPase
LIGNLRTELEQTKQELGWTQERCERLQTEVDKKVETSPVPSSVGGEEGGGGGEWQRKYRELRGKFDAEIDYRTKLKDANLRLKSKLQTMEEKEIWKQMERLNEVLRQKDEAHNKLMTMHMQLQQQLRCFREKEEAVNQRNATIETTLNRMHAEISALQAQIQSWENSDKEKDLELQFVRVEKENLVRQLSASQQSNSQLENALAKLKSVVSDLEQDLKDAITKSSDLNRQLQRVQRQSKVDLPPDMLQLQLAEFRTMVKCSLCNDNFKDVMLTKCSHCFCRGCVNDNLLVARNRKCPLCGTRFAESDVKPVHLSQ